MMHKHIMGFHSVKEFLLIVLGWQFKALAIFNMLLSTEVAMLTLFINSVETWIWSPFYSLIVYFVVLAADFFSGIYVGMKCRKEGFLTQKAQRLPVIFLFHIVLLGIFYNLGKINTDLGVKDIDKFVFDGAARAFYFYVISINIVSFMKNLVLLGYLKGSIAEFMNNYIDRQKNIPNDEK